MNQLCEDEIHQIFQFLTMNNILVISNFNKIYRDVVTNYYNTLSSKMAKRYMKYAIENNNINLVKSLLPQIGPKYQNLFTRIIAFNRLRIMKIFLDFGCIPKIKHLIYASPRRELLELLLEWRGSTKEDWLDARRISRRGLRHIQLKNAIILSNWRGPNGEWIDLRNIYAIGFHPCNTIVRSFIKFCTNWRGPNGEHL